ncbi:hypothetical protein J007_00815 [Cryptococcus neoformans]|nr:hypothetical protein J007_00815 [Cryptococcus neoformans var. grubii]OXC64797.1 hypothetical protein C358_00815 [Cryptococcus neoformans var. grubii MW-RSA852]
MPFWPTERRTKAERHLNSAPTKYPSSLARASRAVSQFAGNSPPLRRGTANECVGNDDENEPNSVEDKINPSMSAQVIRAAYEDFITRQRKDENMTYSRTLAGKILALDATVKVVNKASAHSSKNPASGVKSVVNPFAGGLLTDVNEDKDLFLVSNASFEIQAPVSEYAMRCEKLGVDFANEGEIVVDRCCDYRKANHVDPIRHLLQCALWPYH